MKKRSLMRQVYPSYLLLIIVGVAAVAWYASVTISTFHHARTGDELTAAARLAAEHLKTLGSIRSNDPEASETDALCKTLGRSSGYRLTFVLPSGQVAGDSEEPPETMDNHGSRPEIRDAWSKSVGLSTRYSSTLRKKMMYVAVPVVLNGQTAGVVRASLSLAAVDKTLLTLWHRMAVAGLTIGGLAVLISILVARRIGRPLEEIRRRAEAMGHGDLDERVASSDMAEIDVLATTINRMADELNARINTITQQRDEQNSLLTCMRESVIAVDTEKRILKMNKAAEDLFHVSPAACGRNVMEVIRNNDLRDMVAWALASSELVEGSVALPEDDRYLQVHGTILNSADGRRLGALVVLNDVTRLHRLEVMRREFVGNVSHELRTPITSIKGFVETLQEGGADDPQERKRFLDIVARQVSRLEAILNDLLALSRLEHDTDKDGVELASCDLGDALQQAVDVCEDRARKKKIPIVLRCPPGLTVRLNAPLFEQAIVNLVDNAVKYSEENAAVEIVADQTDSETRIAVRDHGSGIEKKHLARLFERFYRADKGRSRQMGGTGLGLAIVKHIVLAHRGRVDVESEPGQGSTFTIHLPI